MASIAHPRVHPTQDLLDPATYPATAALTDRCDLVMKGGITSGVIYPHAVCQLAITRRLVRVGGTSAGAIAAAAAAAAECGRDTARVDAGFPRLAALPGRLADALPDGHTRLYHLFQPQPGTKPLYRLVAVLIGNQHGLMKLIHLKLAALRLIRPLPALVGVVLPLVLLVLTILDGSAWGIVTAVLLLAIGTVAAVVWSLIQRLGRDLPGNHFGLCTGMSSGAVNAEPALTEWMADEFDRIAGKAEGDAPLTFGDLASNGVELAMLTTDLSAGTQNQLPFQSRVWAFDPNEFRQLFPARIVDWMVANSADDDADQSVSVARFAEAGLLPLPLPERLPVIVAVRMSLSFPFLLSTVPLHAIDFSRASSDPAVRPPIVRHRFSDGGITSNFPINFFDAAIPGTPTFGIDLVGVEQLEADPFDNVDMPDDNRAGILAKPKSVDTLGQFVGALRNSVQNWSDSMQARVPGYRDRIVAVRHTKSEGGMNLDMDGSVVLGLTERGRLAGARADEFDFVNHRWIRLRSLLQTLEELVEPAGRRLEEPAPSAAIPSYRDMIAGEPPASYRNHWRVAQGTQVADAIVALGDAYRGVRDADGNSQFQDGAPSPKPRLQVRPKP